MASSIVADVSRAVVRIWSSNNNSKKCLRQEDSHTVTWLGRPETSFTFDYVSGENTSQEELFDVTGLPMVENSMAGYNCCMFAYGQSGSGKTHTMFGNIKHLTDKPSDNSGMTPCVFEYLFSKMQLEAERHKDKGLKFLTKCSFLEIYKDRITDLLQPTSTNLMVREDFQKKVYVDKLTELEVNSFEDVIQLLSKGLANRKLAATNRNKESSRSHSVFTCTIESRWEHALMTKIRFGKLNLVDLAGPERQKDSGVTSELLNEAKYINKSLSTLGLVTSMLVRVGKGQKCHIPYRDSKLTFILRDLLGGKCKIVIMATVSSSNCDVSETLSTLKFAEQAKFMGNTAEIHEDVDGDKNALDISEVERENKFLREQVETLNQLVKKLELKGEGVSKRDSQASGFKLLENSVTPSFNLLENSVTPSFKLLENSMTPNFNLLENSMTSTDSTQVCRVLGGEQPSIFREWRSLGTHDEEINNLVKKKKNFEGIEMLHFWENPPSPEMVRGMPSSKIVSGLFNPSLGLSELRFEIGRSDNLSLENVTFHKKKGKEEEMEEEEGEETEKEEEEEEIKKEEEKKKKKKKKNVKWNEEQIMALKDGVITCGEGKWKVIKSLYPVLNVKTKVQLKDKWRNLTKRKKALSGKD